jgi:Gpi18-like mannosyltransferase
MIRRVSSWLETPAGMLCLFGLGLAIRLVLARLSDGLWFDVTLFRIWSNRLVQYGPAGFYAPTPDYVVDYPPGYLYVLMALGKASRMILGSAPSVSILKLPAIGADLAVAALAMGLATRVSPPDIARRIPVKAIAAAVILFNPGLLLVSSVWGQVDSVLALLVLATVYTLAGPPTMVREGCAIVLLAVAAATKPQVVFAMPVVAVLLLWRHASEPGRATGARLALLCALAIVVVMAMFVPFGLGATGIVNFYRRAGSLYPFTSLWAFNVWGAAAFYRPDVGTGALSIGGVPAFYVGLIMFSGMTAAITLRSWRTLRAGVNAEAVLLLGAAAVTCAGFALLTRTHERYLYLAIPALAPFVANDRFRWALAILSVCFVMNLHFVYVFHSQHSVPPGGAWTIPALYDGFFGLAQDAPQRKALSLITTAACLWIAAFGWEWLGASSSLRRHSLTLARQIG